MSSGEHPDRRRRHPPRERKRRPLISINGALNCDLLETLRVERTGFVKHYRIEKVAKPGGVVLKRKDILAETDKEAIERAEQSTDCPVCDVLRNGEVIGSVA